MCLLEAVLFPEGQVVGDWGPLGGQGSMEPCFWEPNTYFEEWELHPFPSPGVLVFLSSTVAHYSAFSLRFGWQGKLPSILLHLWLITIIDTTLFPSLNLLTSKCSSHRLSTLINLVALDFFKKSCVLFPHYGNFKSAVKIGMCGLQHHLCFSRVVESVWSLQHSLHLLFPLRSKWEVSLLGGL